MSVRHFARVIGKFQDLVTAIGAHLTSTPESGKIPAHVRSATNLLVLASPLPGSVQIELTPDTPGIDVAEPKGEPLVRDTEAARPLADKAAEAALDLMAVPEGADLEEWAVRVSAQGGRSARALRKLMDSVSRADVTMDAKWHEPGAPTSHVAVTSDDAGRASRAITNRQLDSIETDITGAIDTASLSQSLVIARKGEKFKIRRGQLDEDTIRQLHPGALVKAHVREDVEILPGGEERSVYEALSLMVLDTE